MRRPALAAPLAIAATLCLAGTALAGPLPVKKESIDKSDSKADITVEYPATGNAAIDDDIAAWVRGEISTFTDLEAEDQASDSSGDNSSEQSSDQMSYSLDLSYEVGRNDDQGFGVLFTESTFTGGAHPNTDFTTFNYMMPDGWRVYLPEIFDGRKALARISGLAIADLKKQLAGPDGSGDDDTIADGAGQDWDNFADFILGPKSLTIHFAPYQVASYAEGPQEVSIPLSALKGYFRKDWKAPAASFDCAKAGTPVEQAICASVPLARLDRSVAEAYTLQLKYASDDNAKDAAKTAQRDWIGKRDAGCSGGDIGTCLTSIYKARLAELDKANNGGG